MSSQLSLWAELRRRKVVRVAVVYTATAFAVLQAADIMLPRMGVPDWGMSLVVALSVLGFPIALVLAWALELTPDGVRATTSRSEVDPESSPSLLGRRTVLATAALVVLGVGLGAGWFLRPVAPFEALQAASTGPAANSGTEVTAKSVAVLPFADMSETGDQQWFADGIAEEILTSLARVPELRVVGRSSSFLFTASGTDDRVIADTLGVAHVVKGSVRRVGEQLRVSAQLVRATDGAQLWSQTYDRSAADLLDVQRDVAEKVAAALDVFLDDERREHMFAAGTRNVEAFEAYLRGREMFAAAHAGERSLTLADANQWFERALALDPGFAAPAFLHADRYGHLVVDGPDSPVVGPHDLTVQQALEMLRSDFDDAVRARDPHTRLLAEINRALFSTNWGGLPQLLDALQPHASILTVDDPWGRHVPIVLGRFELARTLAEGMTRWDRFNGIGWTQRIQVELAANDLAAARVLLAEARGGFPQLSWFDRLDMVSFMLEGDRAAVIARLSPSDDRIGYSAAVRGEAEAARGQAAAFDAAQGWPNTRLLRVYHELGDRERARELAARVDALPAGPAMLLRELSVSGAALTFDPADTPNFTARMGEAGVDPASLRVMPRLSVKGGMP